MNPDQIEKYYAIANITSQLSRAFMYAAAGVAALIIAFTWN